MPNVSGGQFGLRASAQLDDQVDGQPLYVPAMTIAGQPGAYNVVYVATEGDTVYAIDAATGAVLLSRNLGAPVPESALPGRCDSGGPNTGINSTPVISTVYNTIWVIAATYEGGEVVMRLHALDLGTLQDKVPPVVVSARKRLSDGSVVSLQARASRQRVALMYANGSIYAAFSSYCDLAADVSRGWLLRWDAYTLDQGATNELTDQATTSPDGAYLSSIWMSGYGLATIDQGQAIYFATGNSSSTGKAYDPVTNLSQSVVKVSPFLSETLDHFTPSNVEWLDQIDEDFGSGGVMLVPTQFGPTPRVAVAAGKDGRMFVLNRYSLGGFNPDGDQVLGTYDIGGCWCGPSYFTGADGVARIVTSGGSNVIVWKADFTHSVTLTKESVSPALVTGQDRGLFTSVSSNQLMPETAIIWTVSRPSDANPANVSLYAIDGSNGNLIYSEVAGTWPNTNGNANIVPTIADGRVFVASFKELSIFGLGATQRAPAITLLYSSRTAALAKANTWADLRPGEHALYGRVLSVEGSRLWLKTRDGTRVTVVFADALAAHVVNTPVAGRAALIRGRYDAGGVLVAEYILRAKAQPALWKADQ